MLEMQYSKDIRGLICLFSLIFLCYVVAIFISSGAPGSLNVLLSHSVTTVASHNTIILIITHKSINIGICAVSLLPFYIRSTGSPVYAVRITSTISAVSAAVVPGAPHPRAPAHLARGDRAGNVRTVGAGAVWVWAGRSAYTRSPDICSPGEQHVNRTHL